MIPEDVMVLTVGDHSDEEGSRPGVTVESSSAPCLRQRNTFLVHPLSTPLLQGWNDHPLCLSVLVR